MLGGCCRAVVNAIPNNWHQAHLENHLRRSELCLEFKRKFNTLFPRLSGESKKCSKHYKIAKIMADEIMQ